MKSVSATLMTRAAAAAVWQARTSGFLHEALTVYNLVFGFRPAATIPHAPAFNRRDHRFCYLFASLAALSEFSARKGCRLVSAEPAGRDSILRDDLAPAMPGVDPRSVYRIGDKYNAMICSKRSVVYQWAVDTGRERVDV